MSHVSNDLVVFLLSVCAQEVRLNFPDNVSGDILILQTESRRYKILIRLKLTYASQSWTMNNQDLERASIQGRKSLGHLGTHKNNQRRQI